jgi:hypothetical protein
MPIGKDTIIMKKLDKEKLVKEFINLRKGVKDKLSLEDIKEEIKQVRKR